MTPEQLEAHRVRFEQRFGETISETADYVRQWRDEATYSLPLLAEGWQAYQWALIDAAQPPQQSAQPVADGCVFFVDPEIIRWTLAGSPRAQTQLWLAKTARPEDGLTMPLYAAAQPVEVQRVGLQPAQVEAIHDALMQHTRTADIWTFASAIEAAHGILPTSSEGGA